MLLVLAGALDPATMGDIAGSQRADAPIIWSDPYGIYSTN